MPFEHHMEEPMNLHRHLAFLALLCCLALRPAQA